jgi:hypothetical protein
VQGELVATWRRPEREDHADRAAARVLERPMQNDTGGPRSTSPRAKITVLADKTIPTTW